MLCYVMLCYTWTCEDICLHLIIFQIFVSTYINMRYFCLYFVRKYTSVFLPCPIFAPGKVAQRSINNWNIVEKWRLNTHSLFWGKHIPHPKKINIQWYEVHERWLFILLIIIDGILVVMVIFYTMFYTKSSCPFFVVVPCLVTSIVYRLSVLDCPFGFL
jgi:hypothetical protein